MTSVSDQTQEQQEVAFQIIASVGSARSLYIEAIHAAGDGRLDEASGLIAQGRDEFLRGHHAHMSLVQKAAADGGLPADILLVHAEDQLMSAEGFGILAEEFVSLYRRFYAAQ